MTTTRIRFIAGSIAAVACTSALAGCGPSKSGGSAGSGSSCTTVTGSTAAVQIKNFSFRPSCMSVAVGTKVTFTNEDSTTHTATASGSTFDSGDLKAHQSYTYTFTKAGTYSYICSIHQYMRGTVVVR